jgi:diguanylate cyclase (GGDEF)-like protein
MLVLYAVAERYAGGTPGIAAGFYWLLGGAGLFAVIAAVVGWRLGWQRRRALLVAWPVASLVVTVLTGAIESDATRILPGTITITFAYVGLTCGRWRSLVLVPLGAVAFIVGGEKNLPDELPTVIVTAMMWVLVAEVPAWLIARLERQSTLLRTMAETDVLTELLNRSTLASRLADHAGESTVALIDLDNFKQYNDRHGHEAGDHLLVDFADALRWSVRKQDMIFRLGGDEFLVLLVGANHDDAEQVLDRLRERWAGVGVPVGFSAGVATGEHDLMRLADERMYAAKRARGIPAD